VHVSTFSALLPSTDVLRPDSPVGAIGTPYSRSKADSDRFARRLQARGAPVTITYPGFVVGPNDPNHGESNRFVASILRGLVPFRFQGVLPVADVRYVAAGHAATMRPGQGPRRYLLTGIDTTGGELFDALRRVTGRRLPAVPSPHPVTLTGGFLAEAVQRLSPVRLPLSYEQTYLLKAMPPGGTDSSRTEADLGVKPPPLDETLADTVAWLAEAGHLPDAYSR
jgi:nucleoside-diphosphate-sugar epimerase